MNAGRQQGSRKLLSPEQVEQFYRDGFLVLRAFYDMKREIEPIQLFIHRIIGVLIKKYDLPIQQAPFDSNNFDDGYQSLIAHDRKIGGEVYDAVKQIPAFVRLVSDEKHSEILSLLRDTDLPGVAGLGHGIRIDNPFEERYRADWHQEYPGQLRSIDGLFFWSPLVAVTEELGPVRFSIGSHKGGVVPLHSNYPDNPGTYGLLLKNKEEVLSRYDQIAPLTAPGDLIVGDFLTLHSSGENRGQRARWSMQFRYFNFRDPVGIRISWSGSHIAGIDFRKVHPELDADAMIER